MVLLFAATLTMSAFSAKRKELIRDAQNKLFEPIDKFLKYFEESIIRTSNWIKENFIF